MAKDFMSAGGQYYVPFPVVYSYMPLAYLSDLQTNQIQLSRSSSYSSLSGGHGQTIGSAEHGAVEESWPGRRPHDMDSLKEKIQAASPGTGEVQAAIEACTFKPRERAFTRLITLCGRRKEAQKAMEIFDSMCDRTGLRPNTYTYSALISACSSTGEWDMALDVFRRMKEAAKLDPICKPNQVSGCLLSLSTDLCPKVTYNAIISATERGCRFEECLACFRDMQSSGAVPDSVTYTSAILSCQKLELWDEAIQIFYDLHQNNMFASSSVYATMIDYLGRVQKWEKALDLFLTMQELGQSVDPACCKAMMKAFEIGNQTDMAYRLIEAMWENDINVGMDICVVALRLLAPAARWEECMAIVSRLPIKNEIPIEALNLLVKSLTAAGKVREAQAVEDVITKSIDES